MSFLLGPNRRKNAVAPPVDAPDAVARAERLFCDEYLRLLPKARAYARKKLDDDAEDVVQDAFLDMWRTCYADGNVADESATGLYFRILRRRIGDELRRRVADQTRDERHVLDITTRLEQRLSPSRIADGELLESRIAYIIGALPEQSRRVFQIASANDFNLRVTAERANIPYNTTRWLFLEAKRHLADTLTRDGYAVPSFVPRGRPAGRDT